MLQQKVFIDATNCGENQTKALMDLLLYSIVRFVSQFTRFHEGLSVIGNFLGYYCGIED